MTIRDFRLVYGSGCTLSLGVEEMDGWVFENERLINVDKKMAEYDHRPVSWIYQLDSGALAVIMGLGLD